jgi:hypothetical protein
MNLTENELKIVRHALSHYIATYTGTNLPDISVALSLFNRLKNVDVTMKAKV